jgi:hypothetical protein
MYPRPSRLIVTILAIWATFLPAHGAAIGLESLLKEMTDLASLGTMPDPPFETLQFSSYDRRSRSPYTEGWFANSDGFGQEPIPNFLEVIEAPAEGKPGRYLMVDVAGAGAIVRTWCAVNAGKGAVEIYLDDQEEPVLSGPAEQVLRRRYALITGKDINSEGGFDQYDASYFPIPFAKRLRMIWIGSHEDLHFYHVNVRRYTAPVQMESFSHALLESHGELIRGIEETLQQQSITPMGQGVTFETTAGPEAYVPLFTCDGPGTIRNLTIDIDAEDLWRAPRQAILEAYFDGAPQPQIEAPLGDFFGSGPGIVPFTTLPSSVLPNGRMTCRFPMPFQKSARFMLRNLGSQSVKITGAVHLDTDSPVQGLMHFRAKWRANHEMIAGGGADSRDMPFLLAKGQGVFVGCALMLRNATPNVGDYIWWGEGDEKIYVDGSAFPDWFGTGSEDYFNYSWGSDRLFDFAYCAQPMAFGSGSRGFVVNNRFHITDRIPFQKQFAFYMELMHHTRVDDFSFARIVYYYAPPTTVDDHVRLSHGDVLRGVDFPDYGKRPREGRHADAIILQGEQVFDPTQAGLKVVDEERWSGRELLVFTPPTPGATAEGRFEVPNAGRYTLVLTTARTPRSGIFEVLLNGQPLGGAVDLYQAHVELSRDMAVGGLALTAGAHTLTLRGAGAHEASAGSEIGLDLVWFHQEE